MAESPDVAQALAAGLLAVKLFEDFYSHQVAEGAITVDAAAGAWRRAASAAATGVPENVAARIVILATAAEDRLDAEQAARFE